MADQGLPGERGHGLDSSMAQLLGATFPKINAVAAWVPSKVVFWALGLAEPGDTRPRDLDVPRPGVAVPLGELYERRSAAGAPARPRGHLHAVLPQPAARHARGRPRRTICCSRAAPRRPMPRPASTRGAISGLPRRSGEGARAMKRAFPVTVVALVSNCEDIDGAAWWCLMCGCSRSPADPHLLAVRPHAQVGR